MPTVSIRVSKKILADVSSGIYRTPANALKEIVSNAFDAGAHRVYISTNAPYFDTFTCEDDGEGISAEDFKKIMQRIGSSAKRSRGTTSPKTGRPIIGRIGIGLLAVAQICNRFAVISKRKGASTYFHASVDLKQFDEVEKEKNYKEGAGDIDLGTYEIEADLRDEVGKARHYTKIIMEEIKEGFSTKLVEEKTKTNFTITQRAAKSECFVDFIDSVKNKKFNEVSQYDQLIWELGLLCPVEYIDDRPLPDNTIIQPEMGRLREYDFKVFVDGYEIRKPIFLPTNKALCEEEADFKIYPRISFREKVGGAMLSFTGYLFHQRTRVQPAELQGILIRIKGVAAGSYDRTFLHYPKAEGPMFSQLSGELYVEEGLEEALNIDRNSFNETHRHFLKLQEFLWDFLGGKNGVFQDIRRRSKTRRGKVHAAESEAELRKFMAAIEEFDGVSIKVEREEKAKDVPYTYDKRRQRLIIHSHPFWARSQKERLMQEKLVVALSAAKRGCNTIEAFEKKLLTLLARGK
jgi:hypothetical protein